jgi:hypothetical protein
MLELQHWTVKMVRRIKTDKKKIDSTMTLEIEAASATEAGDVAKQMLGVHWFFVGAKPAK